MNLKKSLRKLTGRSEFYITLVFLALCLLIEVRSHQFFTPNNIVDILSALVVSGIFAIGEFMVIVSGGFDVSFPALASLTGYATTKMLVMKKGRIVAQLEPAATDEATVLSHMM